MTLTSMLLLNAAFCIENPADVKDTKKQDIISKLLAAAEELRTLEKQDASLQNN